ncbi:Phosphatidate cytidylyltransferase 5 [Hirschfeldia incana]|nr:Phosphatidate cytidylyltransferase 5 [Hirschfeldia incana]
MASVVKVSTYNKTVPPVLTTSLCICSCRLSTKKTLNLPPFSDYTIPRLVRDAKTKPLFRSALGRIPVKRRFLTAVTRAESDHLRDDNSKNVVEEEDKQKKASQLKKRVIFGVAIGLPVGGVVLAGGWVFALALAASVFIGSREYFELVRSRGIAKGMTPPPRYVSRFCSVVCALVPLLTLYYGNIDIWVTCAAFVVAMALLVQRGNPRFSQLSSTMFGLFYCGYLPCFWVKLRCGLAAPALNTGKLFLTLTSFSPSFLYLKNVKALETFSSFIRNCKDLADFSWWSTSVDSGTRGNVDLIQWCNCHGHVCFSRWQGVW